MHDRDTKFTSQFDAALKEAGLRVQKAAYRSPNTVAFVERFNQTLRQELLDHFIVFGERHLNHLVSVFIEYYHRLRPHQAKENAPLITVRASKKRRRRKQRTTPEPAAIELTEIRCEKRLGGLLSITTGRQRSWLHVVLTANPSCDPLPTLLPDRRLAM